MTVIADFYRKYYRFAEQSEAETGVPALVTLGQAALESGWGRHAPGNNFFGVKAKASDPPESRQLLRTREVLNRPDARFPEVISVKRRPDGKYEYVVRDWFAVYPSPAAAFAAHGRFLRENSRYAAAFNHLDDPYAFARAVADARYATDPRYSEILAARMREIEASHPGGLDSGIGTDAVPITIPEVVVEGHPGGLDSGIGTDAVPITIPEVVVEGHPGGLDSGSDGGDHWVDAMTIINHARPDHFRDGGDDGTDSEDDGHGNDGVSHDSHATGQHGVGSGLGNDTREGHAITTIYVHAEPGGFPNDDDSDDGDSDDGDSDDDSDDGEDDGGDDDDSDTTDAVAAGEDDSGGDLGDDTGAGQVPVLVGGESVGGGGLDDLGGGLGDDTGAGVIPVPVGGEPDGGGDLGNDTGTQDVLVRGVFARIRGADYVLAPPSESRWVRNVRAAAGQAILRGRTRTADLVHLQELPPEERLEVISEYLRGGSERSGTKQARYYFGLNPDASSEEIRAAADSYPVFRVVYAD